MLRVRILSGPERTGGVPLLEPPGLEPLALGPGLGLLLEFGVCPALPVPRPLILAESVRTGVFVSALWGVVGGTGNFSIHGILSTNQPHQVLAAANR
jgi:hypothetical protein